MSDELEIVSRQLVLSQADAKAAWATVRATEKARVEAEEKVKKLELRLKELEYGQSNPAL